VAMPTIAENVRRILGELPEGARLVVAAKGRRPEEIAAALAAGAGIIGENYVQEAERARAAVAGGAEWHLIGHLQKNKTGKAVALFDMIETVDSFELAAEIDRRCAVSGKVMPVLIEVNSSREECKTGALPEDVAALAAQAASLERLRVTGLMTMGPLTDNAADIRRAFAGTRRLFEEIKTRRPPGVEMRYLSMGMTDSYRIALEEGANIVRIGTGIFGERTA
jgi:pyridoxal phosphate enzyme (YggS family)